MRRKFGTHSRGDLRLRVFEKAFLLAYQSEYFKKTQLYLKMKNWQETNNPYILFSM